jgi:L-lactate dehydrogenase complex protein LldE
MDIDIFIPCFIDQMYPETGFNMVKILEHYNVGVHYNSNQTCCGQMAFNSGFWDEARELGIKFLQDFPGNRPIVAPSASCAGYIKNYYEKLFYNTPWHLEYKKMKNNLFEFTDFLYNVFKVHNVPGKFTAKITYHDSCAALREYGLDPAIPRKLLSGIKGVEIAEMTKPTECCGFGGTFAVKHEAVSTAMAEQKVLDAIATGAEYLVSTDLSCLMHLDGYIKKHQLNLQVRHLIDFLAEALSKIKN